MSKLEIWISGWVEIATGLAIVLSLGFYAPKWEITFCSWCAKRSTRRRHSAMLVDELNRSGVEMHAQLLRTFHSTKQKEGNSDVQ